MVVAVSVVKTIRTLGSFEVENKYRRVSRLGDRLDELSATVNWNAFRYTLEKTCPPSSGPGRPAYDRVQLFKMLVLQSWYGLSDEQLEYQTADRFSFQKFRISRNHSRLHDHLAIPRTTRQTQFVRRIIGRVEQAT